MAALEERSGNETETENGTEFKSPEPGIEFVPDEKPLKIISNRRSSRFSKYNLPFDSVFIFFQSGIWILMRKRACQKEA